VRLTQVGVIAALTTATKQIFAALLAPVKFAAAPWMIPEDGCNLFPASIVI
jgi:hypothetical protein